MPTMRRSPLAACLLAAVLAGCQSGSNQAARHEEPPAEAEATAPVKPNAKVYRAAGDLATSQNNLPEAVRQYKHALELAPGDSATMFCLATVLAADKQFDASLAVWEQYRVATNNSPQALSNLGRTYELTGRWREAEASYAAAIKAEPTNRTFRLNYGILLAKRDRFEEAEDQLSRVLTPAEVQYNLASVCEIRQLYTQARERYAKAIEIDPKLVAARQRLDALGSATLSAAQ